MTPLVAGITAVLAGSAAGPSWASPVIGVPVGLEFQVNMFVTGAQARPSIAMDADGDFVAVWQSNAQDTSGYGIYAQRYNATGVAQGSEFRVNTVVANSQAAPDVAMSAEGDFVVAWASFGQDGSGYGIYAQRYNAAGVAVGGEFRVNTITTNQQVEPAVAMDSDGDFVIMWESTYNPGGAGVDIYVQRYDAAGVAQGGEVRANTTIAGLQTAADVAMDAVGNFVVAWSSLNQDGSAFGVYAQRYDTAGVAQGGEFRVNTTTTGSQSNLSIAMRPNGEFLIAWDTSQLDAGDIFAQRYDAQGIAQGSEFQLNSAASPAATIIASARVLPLGQFVVAWRGGVTTSVSVDQDIFVRRFDAVGVAQGPELRVNTFTTGLQDGPSLAIDADGDAVLGWTSRLQDGSGDGMYAQRFAGVEDVDLALGATGAPDPVAPGVGLNYTFTVNNLHAGGAPTGIAAIDAAIGTGTGIGFDTALPAGFSFVGAAGTDWNCADTSGAIRCDYSGILAPQAATGVTVTAQASTTEGDYLLTALVSGNQFDADELAPGSNNEAEVSVEVAEPPGDTTPDAFTFNDQADVALSIGVISNAITVSGIDAAAAVSVTGGEFSVNGTAFTATVGTVNNGDTVEVRHTSAATPGTAVSTALTIGGVSATFTSTTVAADTTPDAFSFVDQSDVALGALVTSNMIEVTGITAPVAISVTGGEYSIDGGAFTSGAGTANDGDLVRVRHTASAAPVTGVNTTLTIGGVSDTFTSTTVSADSTPDAFAFTDQTGVAVSTVAVSNAITLAGLNAPAPISVIGGEYSIGSGAFTNAVGTVSNGQTVRVRHTSAAGFLAATNTTLTIGGVSDTFTSTTIAAPADATPDAFTFTDQTDVALASLVSSNAITVSGITAAAAVSVTGGEYSINAGAFSSAAGTVNNGDTVRLRHTSAATSSTAVNTTLTIGGVSDTFTSTTLPAPADTTPDAFSFTDQTNVALGAVVTSNTVTVSGINTAAPIVIAAGDYSVNGGAFTRAAGTVSNGDTVAVRVTASATAGDPANTTLTIGGLSDTFTVTTTQPARSSGGGALGLFDVVGFGSLLLGSLFGAGRARRRERC